LTCWSLVAKAVAAPTPAPIAHVVRTAATGHNQARSNQRSCAHFSHYCTHRFLHLPHDPAIRVTPADYSSTEIAWELNAAIKIPVPCP
jgi:hypothetical protein